jgi:hypothetical protein
MDAEPTAVDGVLDQRETGVELRAEKNSTRSVVFGLKVASRRSAS